jgi:murein L,D-transpeptidase YcbB/YkuD
MQEKKYVTLAKTVPVFIAYLTAWVDRAGELQFRNIYNRDNRLAEMILER